jgi:hypothetical protein
MPGLVIGGKQYEVPGVKILNWFDDPKWRLSPEDRAPRPTTWVRSIYNHVTQGDDNLLVVPGAGKPGGAEATLAWWKSDPKSAGAHLIVDYDGSAICVADLLTEIAWNTGAVNNKYNIGHEVKQFPSGLVYEAQVDALLAVVDYETAFFGIQRQVQWPYRGSAIPRLADGADSVGVFAHRDCSNNRGRGDPGDWIVERFIIAGYEVYDFAAFADKAAWKTRQAMLNTKYNEKLTLDGVPGPSTWAALKRAGYPNGMWVSRPLGACSAGE